MPTLGELATSEFTSYRVKSNPTSLFPQERKCDDKLLKCPKCDDAGQSSPELEFPQMQDSKKIR